MAPSPAYPCIVHDCRDRLKTRKGNAHEQPSERGLMKRAREGASTQRQMAMGGAKIIVARHTIRGTLEDIIRSAETGVSDDSKQAITTAAIKR